MFLFIFLLSVIVSVIYLYLTRNFKYWEVRGVKYEKPVPILGTYLPAFKAELNIAQMTVKSYWKYPNEKVVGWFRRSMPELVIRDPEIAKRVLVTDFASFHARGFLPQKTDFEPLMRNLFFANGDVWRLLRQRMTPAFTSGKLKAMFPLIVERAEKLQLRLIKAAANGKAIDARDTMARFTTDFIGACGFGLNSDSLQDENSAFRKLGADIFKHGPKQMLVKFLKELFPHLARHLKYTSHMEKDVFDLVTFILKERNYQVSGRNDFIDLMLECRQKGIIKGESIEKIGPNGVPESVTLELTDVLIAAQVFVFFGAGFETSSSSTSHTLHQLAYHPEVLKKVQADVDQALEKHNNKLSYDAISEMKYLEATFKESMRLLPILGIIRREAVRKFTIPELNITIDKGVGVFIPIHAMQNDPKYFSEPDKFNPDRFLPENMKKEIKDIYLPFGTGPRACIGERLGLMQSLAGLAAVLSKFDVEPDPILTKRHPVIDPKNDIVQTFSDGLPLIFKERIKNAL